MARNRRIIEADYYEEGSERPERSERSRRRRSDVENRQEVRHNSPNNERSNNNASNSFDFGNIDMGQIAGLMQNVDMNQLSGLLKNVDIGQLTGMLSGLGGGGGGGLGALGLLGNLMGGLGSAPQETADSPRMSVPYSGDKRIDLLSAIRPMLTPDRAGLVDMIIQLYAISKILKR